MLFSSCVVDGVLSYEYIYVNSTNHTIVIKEENRTIDHIIKPDSTYSIGATTHANRRIDPNSLQPTLMDTIVYDNIKCQYLDYTEGVNSLSNFVINVIGRNNYKYIYTFTKEDYLKAEDCN